MSERAATAEELRRTVQRGATWTVLLQHAAAGKAGLNVTDAQCIGLLVLDGPQTPGRLARAMGITTGGAITAVIDRLEQAGHVRRTPDPRDRRRVIVEPVAENVARFAAAYDPISRAFLARAAEVTDEQLRFLLDWYRSINEMMPGVIEEIRSGPSGG